MSQGGQFRLVLQSSEQDSFLNDNSRFSKIINRIKLQKNDTWTKDIADVESLYTVFVSGTYRPYMTVGFEYSRSETQEGIAGFGKTVRFNINHFGDLLNDTCLHLKLTNLIAVSALDKVRYCAFPGHKILKWVRFFINHNKIAEYNFDYPNAYYNSRLSDDKQLTWRRAVGQETPVDGYVTPNPNTDEYKIRYDVYTGAQTFKRTQSTLDMWIPLLFPFNEVKNALPILTIPYGQIYIEIEFANASDVISYANYGGGGSYTAPTFDTCELYQNEIYIPDVMHELFKKPGMLLIRKQLTQKFDTTNPIQSVLLHDIHFPTESIHVAFSPTVNSTYSQSWHKNKVITATNKTTPIVDTGGGVLVGTLSYDAETDVVTKLGLSTNSDIVLYPTISPSFYENYLPYRFFKSVPKNGWYTLNFNLFPDNSDPSGHINFSISREIRLNYESTFISSSNTTTCIVIANVLAFILLKDYTGILKFST